MDFKGLNDEKDNLQNGINETFFMVHNMNPATIQLHELIKFCKHHFNEFHQKKNLKTLLAFTHRFIKEWIDQRHYLKDDIAYDLDNLMNYCEDEKDLNIAIQIVYQILYSIMYFGVNDIRISENLLHEFVSTLTLIKSRILISCYIACIQLYVKMFPENRRIIHITLWPKLMYQFETNLKLNTIEDSEVDILIQMIDDFNLPELTYLDNPVLVNTIQHLLKSDQRKYRKCGYYLLKKLVHCITENLRKVVTMWISADNNENIEQSWMKYITILENLEEEQSHLILPSLENLEQLIKNQHLQSSWCEILYMRILTHNNNLVVRWSVEFFLKKFSYTDLSKNTLIHLLEATNSNLLYNYEGYFLDNQYYSSFLKGDLTKFLTLLPEVKNWKSLPLYIWLANIKNTKLTKSLSFELIIKISACVRNIQNCVVRAKAIDVFHKLFEDSINKMSMNEFVTCVETLYNPGDLYKGYDIFFNKKFSTGFTFKQRFYEIFTNNKFDNSALLSFLSKIPVEDHGWLKYAPFRYKLTESDRQCIEKLYKLSLKYCDLNTIIEILQNNFLKTNQHDKHELWECKRAAISFYVLQESELKDKYNEDTLSLLLNHEIGCSLVEIVAENFLANCQYEIDLCIIDKLLKYNSNRVFDSVGKYLERVCNTSVYQKYAAIIFEKYNVIPTAFSNVNLLQNCADKLLNSLASKGETRIEELFCSRYFGEKIYLRPYFFDQIKRYGNNKFLMDLLKHHTDITKKKPRYFENSNEHRVKLRIAICVYYTILYAPSDHVLHPPSVYYCIINQLWTILLNENNQSNVMYIYEYILGKYETRSEFLLNKLEEACFLTPSQQATIISVSHTYFQLHNIEYLTIKTNSKEQILARDMLVSTLLSLSMGCNFQSRFLAQLSLIELLKRFIRSNSEQKIINLIERAIGTKLTENMNEIRIHINNLSKSFDLIDIILYVTNAPFDEIIQPFEIPETHLCFKQIVSCRERFLKKFKLAGDEQNISRSTMIDQIQRKMNPVNELSEPHNLIVYPTVENSAEMFVVASLVDKIPNLGGIARTCEVLGIKNLVIDSKMHIQKHDFKNISMTAEKTLNIVEVKPKYLREFLMNKKLEGFDLVGAEQTINSHNFCNFQLPKKCILLLGHEKEGIPAPLLGLLDYAVQIPQFGQIRSLNVHVTGALFMWEYCKQHLVRKE